MRARVKVAAARRSWGASGNLIRGLEAPVHSPQEQLPALRLLNGVRPAKETTASADGPDHPPPATAREAGNPRKPAHPGHRASAQPNADPHAREIFTPPRRPKGTSDC